VLFLPFTWFPVGTAMVAWLGLKVVLTAVR
jgi:hypothetical protein